MAVQYGGRNFYLIMIAFYSITSGNSSTSSHMELKFAAHASASARCKQLIYHLFWIHTKRYHSSLSPRLYRVPLTLFLTHLFRYERIHTPYLFMVPNNLVIILKFKDWPPIFPPMSMDYPKRYTGSTTLPSY